MGKRDTADADVSPSDQLYADDCGDVERTGAVAAGNGEFAADPGRDSDAGSTAVAQCGGVHEPELGTAADGAGKRTADPADLCG